MLALRLRVVRILWGALMMSVVLLGGVLLVVRTPGPPHGSVDVRMILASLAGGVAILSVVMPRVAFAKAVQQLALPVEERPGEAIGGFRESAPVTRIVTGGEDTVARTMAAFQTSFLIGMSLAESIALMGLMLGRQGDLRVAPAFFAVSLLLMASKMPRLESIRAAVERATNARFE